MSENRRIPLPYRAAGARPLRRRVRPWFWYGLVGGTLIVMVAFGCITIWYVRQGVLPTDEATSRWQSRFQSDWDLWWPSSYKVTRGSATGWRDLTYWFRLDMPPADVASFKTSIVDRLKSPAIWKLEDDEATDKFAVSGSGPPFWWNPQECLDADRLAVRSQSHHYCFFFSTSTGRVYVYWMRNY